MTHSQGPSGGGAEKQTTDMWEDISDSTRADGVTGQQGSASGNLYLPRLEGWAVCFMSLVKAAAVEESLLSRGCM